jgi:hypothetical protein
MSTTSRVGRALRATLILAPAAALVACGSSDSTPAAGPTVATPSAPASSAAPSSPASSAAPAGHATAGQVVEVTKYGLSYQVPKHWTSLDGSKALNPDSPILRTVAQRLNLTPRQVLASFKQSVAAMAVTDQGARNGILDNINSVGTAVPSLDDDQIELQLATLGAKTRAIHHFTSPAGHGSRIAYGWTTNGLHFHGEILTVDVGDAIVSITVTAHSTAAATSLADQVQASIDRLG